MADEGFKRKLTTILSADFKCYRCFVSDAEPMPHKLASFHTSATDIGRRYQLLAFYRANGRDDREYVINSGLKFITKKGE